MNDDSWVIIWYRVGATAPTINPNIINEETALRIAEDMRGNPRVALVVCVTSVAALKRLGGGWDREEFSDAGDPNP